MKDTRKDILGEVAAFFRRTVLAAEKINDLPIVQLVKLPGVLLDIDARLDLLDQTEAGVLVVQGWG